MDKGLIFTYLMSYGGAAASLFSPYVGLLIYIAFDIIQPSAMWFWSVPQDGNFSRLVAGGLLAGWALKGFGRWNLGRGAGVTAALVCYWLWSAFSAALFAANDEKAWEWVWVLTKIVLPFLVGVTTIDSLGKVKALAW